MKLFYFDTGEMQDVHIAVYFKLDETGHSSALVFLFSLCNQNLACYRVTCLGWFCEVPFFSTPGIGIWWRGSVTNIMD